MAKKSTENFHKANGLAEIHQGRIAGKEVDPLFLDPGATIMVVKIDHIPSDEFTGKQGSSSGTLNSLNSCGQH